MSTTSHHAAASSPKDRREAKPGPKTILVKVFAKVEGGRYKVGNAAVAGTISVRGDNAMEKYNVGDVLKVECKRGRYSKNKVKMEASGAPPEGYDADFSVFMHAAAMVLNDEDKVLVLLNGNHDFISLKYILVQAVEEERGGLSDYIKRRFNALTGQDNVKNWTKQELTATFTLDWKAMAGGSAWMKDKLRDLPRVLQDWSQKLKSVASAEIERRAQQSPEWQGMPIWCLPGGLPDHWSASSDPNGFESPEEVSRRELLEEAEEAATEHDRRDVDRSLELLEQFQLEYEVEGGVSFCNHVLVYRTTKQDKFRGQEEFRGGQEWVSLAEFGDGVQPDGRFYHMLKVGPTERWHEIVEAVTKRLAKPAADELPDLAVLRVAEK